MVNLKDFKRQGEKQFHVFDARDAQNTIKEIFQKHSVPNVYSLEELDPYTLTSLGIKGQDLKIAWENVRLLQQRNLKL